MSIYLIKRGPRCSTHKAPFHPVVIASLKRVARWEAGWTGDAAWIWTHETSNGAGGWLIERWSGLDIDYGHVIRGGELPDFTPMGFVHDRMEEPWSLIAGAIWWSDKPMPGWLAQAGCLYAPDAFSQQCILDKVADDGVSGCRRERPQWWPIPAPMVRHEVTTGARIPNGTVVAYARLGEAPVRATVQALFYLTEAPNGCYGECYDVVLETGKIVSPSRRWLETANPHLVEGEDTE